MVSEKQGEIWNTFLGKLVKKHMWNTAHLSTRDCQKVWGKESEGENAQAPKMTH